MRRACVFCRAIDLSVRRSPFDQSRRTRLLALAISIVSIWLGTRRCITDRGKNLSQSTNRETRREKDLIYAQELSLADISQLRLWSKFLVPLRHVANSSPGSARFLHLFQMDANRARFTLKRAFAGYFDQTNREHPGKILGSRGFGTHRGPRSGTF